jgi:hypothetical protein
VANEHVTYATWQSTYMTGVPSGYWAGKFLAVCDPEPPPDPGGPRRPNPGRLPGERLLEPQQAAKAASAGLREYGLHERKDWGRALKRVRPSEPILVERLDRPNSFYYIVPLGRSEQEITAFANVDARVGNYQQALSLPQPEPNFLQSLREEAVLEVLVGRKVGLPDRLGELVVADRPLCVYPSLVWRPCRESLSPFYPFRMIVVGSQRIYIRSDGQIFTKLHVDDRGI